MLRRAALINSSCLRHTHFHSSEYIVHTGFIGTLVTPFDTYVSLDYPWWGRGKRGTLYNLQFCSRKLNSSS